ncbi:ATP-grasp domain-containing protein [Pseudoalteromonas sp. DL2-H2.2]|uniref:ATP-grasp domain-containing protein n=1 Tax=Pseudoalteromonas sp. DL2-H2.2 TaxID=2908889 RepID=UPI001F41870B|nr:ATP-grasp domain-containing protein [Pseudoalteromonas sp. DL2-H2.2]MCF2907560.1 ATP-grasp domain-containing protein [Pseudoalteromonas sp. DL2-H2.2]
MKNVVITSTYTKLSHYNHEQLAQMQGVNFFVIVRESERLAVERDFGATFPNVFGIQGTSEEAFFQQSKSYISELMAQKEGESFYIVTMAEDLLLVAAKLREAFNLTGMNFEQTYRFRNKGEMKKILQKANIRVPYFGKLDLSKSEHKAYFEEIVAEVGLPFIIKPTMMACSNGVSKIESFDAFAEYLDDAQPNIEYGYEEFISGKLYHCDSIVSNGEVIFSSACEYTNENMHFQKGKSVISMPLPDDLAISQEILAFNKAVLNELGMEQGVNHLEVFKKGDELVFLEVACRAPGAVVVPMYERQFGFNFLNTNLEMELGLVPELSKSAKVYCFSGIFPVQPGTAIELVEPQLQSRFDMNWNIKQGQKFDSADSLRDIAGSIQATNQCFDTLREDFRKLIDFHAVNCA